MKDIVWDLFGFFVIIAVISAIVTATIMAFQQSDMERKAKSYCMNELKVEDVIRDKYTDKYFCKTTFRTLVLVPNNVMESAYEK